MKFRTDLLESNEDMTFSISVLSVGLTKKEVLDLFLRKCLCEHEILSFIVLAFEIAIGLNSGVRLGISAEMFLIFRIDFMPCVLMLSC